MTTVLQAQSEIFDRLRVLSESRRINDGALAELEREYQEKRAVLLADNVVIATEVTSVLAQLQELDENGTMSPVPLAFDSDGKTFRWAGGSVRLGKIPCKLIKTLYNAPKKRLKGLTLVQNVWGQNGTTRGTEKTTVSVLNKTLKKAQCPYEVVKKRYKISEIVVSNDFVRGTDGQYKPKKDTVEVDFIGYKLVVRAF